jgi:hypothetical protein
MLSGLPLFDLFSKMGVTMGLGANQLLTFDVAKLNKVRPAESRPGACSRSLCSLCQVDHCQLVEIQQQPAWLQLMLLRYTL